MGAYIDSLERLIEKLIRLPGIGRRSAERILGYILNAPSEEVRSLAEALLKARERVRLCRICNNLSEGEICRICQDEHRRKELLCIVGRAQDVAAIEKSGVFNGVYHVLMGSIAPLEGRGPADLKIDGLLARVRQNNIKEAIIATDSDTEGEATALYLVKILKPLGVRLSRIGMGLPVGSSLEYADRNTLGKALESRRII